ncbi:hypothetical protein CJO94_05795 [Ralstonia solanacearum]|nr:hypothetical protein CJO94_05795 [Ralstonia solanacearum]
MPPGALVEYWTFCKAVAEAVRPTDEEGLEGIDCIVGKMAKPKAPSVPVSEGGHPLGRSVPDQRFLEMARLPAVPFEGDATCLGAEVSLPYELDESDRRALNAVLPKLPSLRYPMSEDEAMAFMDAYRKLPSRPTWEPILITAADVEQRKGAQAAAWDHHQGTLQKWFRDGRLVAVDSRHAPVAALMTGTFIPRNQAVAYLEWHGLAHSDTTAGSAPDSPEQSSAVKSALTDEQRRELVAYCKALKIAVPKVKAPTKQTAEKFNVSEGYVRRLLRQDEAQSTTGGFPRTKRK